MDALLKVALVALTRFPGEQSAQRVAAKMLLPALTRRRALCRACGSLESWRSLMECASGALGGMSGGFGNQSVPGSIPTSPTFPPEIHRLVTEAVCRAAEGLAGEQQCQEYITRALFAAAAGKGLSQSPRSAYLIAHTRTRRDVLPPTVCPYIAIYKTDTFSFTFRFTTNCHQPGRRETPHRRAIRGLRFGGAARRRARQRGAKPSRGVCFFQRTLRIAAGASTRRRRIGAGEHLPFTTFRRLIAHTRLTLSMVVTLGFAALPEIHRGVRGGAGLFSGAEQRVGALRALHEGNRDVPSVRPGRFG